MYPEESKKTSKRAGRSGRHYEERLRTIGVSSLKKRRARSNFIALYTFLRRECIEEGAGIFSLVTNGRMCGDSTQLHQGMFRHGIRKIFCTVGVTTPLLQVSSGMPDACQCSRNIWTMPLITYFNFWLAPKWSGSWT